MKYTISVHNPEDWQEIHDVLCGVSSCPCIPDREVTCTDEKLHSPTRGTFDLEDHEAEELKSHEKIAWVELCPTCYSDSYPKPFLDQTDRWPSDVKVYRDLGSYPPPGVSTVGELNRTNWAMPRVGILTNGVLWPPPVSGNPQPISTNISYNLTGANVDVIIHDSGILQYHPEFMKDDGTSRVRDIVLDGPYYIDPDYFQGAYGNPDPSKTYTKPDGRVGVNTADAVNWWQNSSMRSSGFSTIGTVTIPGAYTAPNALGVDPVNGTSNMSSGHGTASASLAAGKNFGLAFEANIWNMPGIGDVTGMSVETNYDLMKLFHQYKPVRGGAAQKDPTVINGSWGYRAGFYSFSGAIDYKFQNQTGTFDANSSTVSQVTAMKNGLYASGFTYFWASSSRSNSTDQAAYEMMESGVIYVASAGNNNQRLGVGADDLHRLDYMEDAYFGTTDPRSEFPSGTVPSGHRDWMNPQGIGFKTDSDFHPVICVGAMDEFILTDGTYRERKASYSNNGPGIDVWSPADETLAAGGVYSAGGYTLARRQDDNNFWDCNFNGTSAASPVCAGQIALYMERYPTATSIDVKTWLKNNGSGSYDIGTSMYQDQYTDSASTSYWTGSYNMRGAATRIQYNSFANETPPPPPTAVYEFGSIPTSIEEGSSGIFNVGTTNVSNGTTLYWTINNGTTVDADFDAVSGSFTITANNGSFTVTAAEDVVSEGTETFNVFVRTGSISGTIVLTSASVNLTNVDPPPPPPPAATSPILSIEGVEIIGVTINS